VVRGCVGAGLVVGSARLEGVEVGEDEGGYCMSKLKRRLR
jgi:hypothetical protein